MATPGGLRGGNAGEYLGELTHTRNDSGLTKPASRGAGKSMTPDSLSYHFSVEIETAAPCSLIPGEEILPA